MGLVDDGVAQWQRCQPTQHGRLSQSFGVSQDQVDFFVIQPLPDFTPLGFGLSPLQDDSSQTGLTTATLLVSR
jgi:hypothetical protein